MIFEKEGVSVCFVHIPRNGGRYIQKLLKTNSFRMSKKTIEMQKQGFHLDQEYMHLTYDKVFDVHPEAVASKKVVIVRNPIDKFKSAVNSEWSMKLYFGGYEKFLEMNDPVIFDHTMRKKRYSLRTKGRTFAFKGLANTFTNWFRPQHEFFDEDFCVWKFENGFGKEFSTFLHDEVGLDVDINKIVESTYSLKDYDNKIDGFVLSEKIKENILNFYRTDYDIWNKL